MKVYMADEIAMEMSDYDVPGLLVAEESVTRETDTYVADQIIYWVGAVEGYIAGRYGEHDSDYNVFLDDPEYPGRRVIKTVRGTIMVHGRFSRNKEYVMAFNRFNDAAARECVQEWIDEGTEP